MTRSISIFLVLLLAVSSLAVPARADEVEFDNLLNVLDYSTANNTGSNYVGFTGETSVTYVLPGTYLLDYVDMVISTAGAAPSEILVGRNSSSLSSLSIVKISSGLYRVYGSIASRACSSLVVKFVSVDSASSSWYTILQFNVCRMSSLDSYPVSVLMEVTSNSDAWYGVSDDLDRVSWGMTVDSGMFNYSCFVDLDQWYLYDYIDIAMLFDVPSVDSFICQMEDVIIPYSISYVQDASNIYAQYYVTIRLDLTGVDRSLDPETHWPTLMFTGKLNPGAYNFISVVSCVGLVDISYISPLQYFFNKLGTWITEQTDALIVNLDEQFLNLNAGLSYWLQAIDDQLKLQYELEDAQFQATQTLISNMRSAMVTQFTNLKTFMSEQYDALTAYLDTWHTMVVSWFSKFDIHLGKIRESIHEHTEEIKDTLISLLDRDSSLADDFNQDVDDRGQELDDMSQVMDSVTKPALDSINVNVDTYLDSDNMSVLSSTLSIFLTGDLFGPILVMTILMATVSFLLYGKR